LPVGGRPGPRGFCTLDFLGLAMRAFSISAEAPQSIARPGPGNQTHDKRPLTRCFIHTILMLLPFNMSDEAIKALINPDLIEKVRTHEEADQR